jgi:hypothetical protein
MPPEVILVVSTVMFCYWLNQRVIAYGALLSALAFLIHGYFLS